jgi:hypothetical protein
MGMGMGIKRDLNDGDDQDSGNHPLSPFGGHGYIHRSVFALATAIAAGPFQKGSEIDL